MLPVFLEINAFGPFSGNEKIDFRPFYEHDILHISGPTGSGKTTILDALCFALYGETTGEISKSEGRLAKAMRSDFSDQDESSFVKFTFKLGLDYYVVTRTLGEARKKKKGEGYTTSKPTASLIKTRNLDSDACEVLEPIKPSAVSKIIVSMLGLNVNQFRQVVILPQGKFREFIVSDSQVKEKILESMFDFHVFSEIVNAVKEDERALENKLSEYLHTKKVLLGSSGVETYEELEDLIKETNEKLGGVDRKTKNTKSQINHQREIKESYNKQFVYLEKLKTLEDNILKMRDEEAAILSKEQALANFEKFSHPIGLLKLDESITEDITKYRSKFDMDQTSLNALELQYSLVRDELDQLGDYDEVCKNYLLKLENIRSRKDILKKFNETNNILLKSIEGVQENQRSIEEVSIRMSENKDKQALMQDERSLVVASIESLESEKSSFSSASLAKGIFESVASIDVKLKKIGSNKKFEQDNIRKNRRLIEDLHFRKTKIATDLKSLYSDYIRQTLTHNDDCPVCGAEINDQTLSSKFGVRCSDKITPSTQDDFNKVEAEIAKISQDIAVGLAKIEAYDTQCQELGSEKSKYQESLKSLGFTALSEVETLFEKQRGADRQCQLDRKKLQSLDEQLSTLEAEYELHRQSKQECLLKLERASTQVDSLKERLKEFEASESLENLENMFDDSQNQFEAFKANYSRLRDALKDISNQRTKVSVFVNQGISSLENAVAQKIENDLKIDRLLLDFNVERQEVLGYYLSEDDRRNLTVAVSDFRKKWEKNQALKEDVLSSMDQTLLGISADALSKKIDLLLDEIRGLEEVLTELNREKGEFQEKITRFDEVFSKLSDLETNFKVKEKKLSQISFLSRSISGQSAEKFSLPRYALSLIYDDILRRATIILSQITNGRYSFSRRLNHDDARKAFGLETDVFDEFTGKKRPINTLSGGEGFLASLSLALGLSQAAESSNAAVRLDMLFIDEGFGSLDSDSLGRLVDVLKEIGSLASVVGIITHVSELKDEIQARIDVTPTPSGSTIHSSLEC